MLWLCLFGVHCPLDRVQQLTIIIAALALSATAANAEPLPQPKPPGPGGSCPHGDIASGSFCVPGQGAQDAVAKPGERHVSAWLAVVGLLLPARPATSGASSPAAMT